MTWAGSRLGPYNKVVRQPGALKRLPNPCGASLASSHFSNQDLQKAKTICPAAVANAAAAAATTSSDATTSATTAPQQVAPAGFVPQTREELEASLLLIAANCVMFNAPDGNYAPLGRVLATAVVADLSASC